MHSALERTRCRSLQNVLLIATLVATSSIAPRAWAVVNGTDLGSDVRHTGIFRIRAVDGDQLGGTCTATLLYSSSRIALSWLVTSAHCFSYRDDLFYVYSHFAQPRTRVRYVTPQPDGGTSLVWSDERFSTVYVHPEWLANGGHTAWFGPRDIAFIRVDHWIPVYDENNELIREFRRPIYTGRAESVSEPFVAPAVDAYATEVFCGHGSGTLRCDRLKNLWYSPNFRHQFLQLPHGAWTGGFYEAGDSGGPLLKLAPGLARRWNGDRTDRDVARNGVVLAVLQGPTVFCDYIQNGNCDPADALATRFQGIEAWLATIPRSSSIPRVSRWSFVRFFEGGTGSATNFAEGSFSYTRPAYTARIVGIGVEKQAGRVHVWYSNGFRTMGTATDPDVYSEHPFAPDTLPTHTYSLPAGQRFGDIVAMFVARSGEVFSYYRDGTYASGTAADLGRSYTGRYGGLPRGKTADDIVAMAEVPVVNESGITSVHIYTYFRDGTRSRGSYSNLALLEADVAFETTSGRRPDEIVGADARDDGTMLTFFEHPELF